MLRIFEWSPRYWFGSGQCAFWFGGVAYTRLWVWLARRLGAQLIFGSWRCVRVVWPVGCVGSRLFSIALWLR